MNYNYNLKTREHHHILKIGLIILVIILFLILIKYKQSEKKLEDQKLILVATALAKKDSVPIYINALGSVTPDCTVVIKPQVSGRLVKILFKDGQKVKEGDVLAQIDERPYQAQLLQYQGQLMRDKALLKNAEIDLQRYENLWQEKSISKQILDTQKALVEQYEGTIEIDQGLVDNAKVNLSYCYITSPIDGQIGLSKIDEGNIIQIANNDSIAVVNTIAPITVIFSVPENILSKILTSYNKNNSLLVLAYDHEQNKLLARGSLLAIDNQIDPATGSIKLKAEFKNEENKLFPNQFVNVKLLIDTLNEVVIPITALQHGQKGDFVYKVLEDNKVTIIPVVRGESNENEVIITSGIVEDDIVVIEGADNLTEGAVVKIGGMHEPI